MPALPSNRSPDGNHLSQTGTVNIVDARYIQDEEALSVGKKAVDHIPQRQIENPQPAFKIENDNFVSAALDNLERHRLDSTNSYARPATSPFWVFTRTTSPSFMNSGTRTSRPVSSFAPSVPPPAAVSPRNPGSVEAIANSTYWGNCMETALPLYLKISRMSPSFK